MPETKSRRPVDEDHPVVKAAKVVLTEHGGPLKLSEVFERASSRGLLPESAVNTIRGRLSQHLQHFAERPVVIKLPKRRGWMAQRGRLRGLKVTRAWVEEAQAPAPLINLVSELEGEVTLAKLLAERGLDPESVRWLLETLPFDPELRDRLMACASSEERRAVLRGAV